LRTRFGIGASPRRLDLRGILRHNPIKENNMRITRSSTVETAGGPEDWFTGTVFVDTVATPSEHSRLGSASVHFTPEARTAWHTHPLGQTIYVTEGVGLCQRRAERSR
jgi:quercetin dioxygenase-like cupin family protein